MQDGDNTEPNHNNAAAVPTSTPAKPETNWQFKNEKTPVAAAPASHNAVSWTASEFIAHDKADSWYIKLAVGALLLAALVYLLTRDLVSVIVIAIFAAIFGFFAARKPRVLNYALDNDGLHIGNKFYAYTDFKSFSVIDEGGIGAIWLMPLKRFMPSLTIYFAPDDEDKIITALTAYLPFEERDADMVERMMRRMRF